MDARKLLALAALVLAAACSDDDRTPVNPEGRTAPGGAALSVADEYAGGPVHGAIFTTTPDGGIVNENTHYTQKIEVYLDGGPRNQVKQTAAGLPDGLYVFQITDPPGKVLLSEDPSKCRVVRVDDGIIKQLVAPSQIPGITPALSDSFRVGNGANAPRYPCHVQDGPAGAAGASGRHDTNTDVDHGADGAIVVQMMPFFDTPNPGGVYKAWMTPLQEYLAKDTGADRDQLDAVPVEQKVQGKKIGYQRDFGFSPPRNNVKTDNFKVRENPPFIVVRKYDDVDGNGQLGAPPDSTMEGWPVSVIEPVDGSFVRNDYFTTTDPIKVPFSTTVQVCEQVLSGWTYSFARVGSGYVAATDTTIGGLPYKCVAVTTGSAFATIDVAFGNYRPAVKSGAKFHDLNADSAWSAGTEPGLANWVIHLFGTNGRGNAVSRYDTTDIAGRYEFAGLDPGSYTVCEVLKADWHQSYPKTGTACAAGYGPRGYAIQLTSAARDTNNHFGNFQTVTKSGRKYDSSTGDPIAGWIIHLLNGAGTQILATDTTDSSGYYAFAGLLPGRTLIVCEELPGGTWVQVSPTSGYDCASLGAGLGKTFGTYGYQFTTVSGIDHPNNDFRNNARFHGCTPGYWKQSQHFGNWTAPYSPVPPQTLLSTAFTHYDGQGGYAPLMTMLQALDLDNSMGIGQVLRHGVAALLNSANGSLTFPLTQTGVKNLVNSALDAYDAGDQAFVNGVHARLAGYNESSLLGCPLARAELP